MHIQQILSFNFISLINEELLPTTFFAVCSLNFDMSGFKNESNMALFIPENTQTIKYKTGFHSN